jgi:60 kDa SS-A/Ro ribonucleoprotein
MQNVTRFLQATPTHKTGRGERRETHLNHECAPAYHRSLREQVLQVLMTGMLSDTFYASGAKLGAEATNVLLKARTECPDFLAKALVYARNDGFMKSVPVLGLAVLSGGRGRTRSLFESVFPQVVRTPDDLRSFVVLCKSGTIPGRKGLGGVARQAVREWLQNLSEYHALKYGSAASREITLRDILRLTHPSPSSAALSERFGWLIRGSEQSLELNSQIKAFEALKQATSEEEVVALVRQGRLPYEVVVPAAKQMTPAIWEQLFHLAPYMNLLRNLVTFTRHGVFQSSANVEAAVKRLTNPEAVKHSKVLPFRFYDAWKRYVQTDGNEGAIADALRAALELSFCNMPSLGNRTVAIGPDTSGSMSWTPISERSSTQCIDIAGIFTGALMRRVEDRAIPLPFDTRVHTDLGLSARDDILVTADRISKIGGGGTAVGAPVQHLLDRKIKVDAFVGITDNVDWAYGHQGYGYECRGSFLDLWRSYRREVAPEARAYLVTVAPYLEAVAPSGEKGVRFIYGWSDRVLNYITHDLESGSGQVQAVEQMKLTQPGAR